MLNGEENKLAEEQGTKGKAALIEHDVEKSGTSSSNSSERAQDHSDRISIATAEDGSNHPSQAPSLARTKSKSAQVAEKVLSKITTRVTEDPGPPPDGGFFAWLQVFCGWVAILNTWGFVNSFGAFQTYYENTLPQSSSTISWIGSIQAALMLMLGAFSGRALDAGLLRPAMFIGFAFQVLGIFCMSGATKYWQLLLTQGVLTGIGGGIFFTPVMACISTYFLKNRGMAIGIVTSGNATGGIIYPLVVRQLLPKIGFGWTTRVLGLITLVCLGFTCTFTKQRLPPRKAGPIFEVSAIKDIPYALFVCGICFLMAAMYFVFYYIGSYGRDEAGMSYTDTLNLVIVLNAVGVPSRVIPGILADRYFGVLNTFTPLVISNVVILLGWLAVSDLKGYYVWTVFYGIFLSGWQSMFPTAIASLSSDLSKAGTRLGMAFSVISISALVGGPIGGAILDAAGGRYFAPIVWAAVTTAGGATLVAAARVTSKGWSLKVKC